MAPFSTNFSVLRIAFLCYIVVLGITIMHHAMWLDEWNAIQLVNDSRNLRELWVNSANDHHPFLWWLMLFVVKPLGHSYVIPQVLQFFIATGFVYIILKYAPFSKWMRILLVFGYFFVFEYSVFARNYGISVLLLGGVLAVWPNRYTQLIKTCILLFLLSQTTVFACFLVVAFTGLTIYDLIWSESLNRSKNLWLFSFAGLGVIVSLLTFYHGNTHLNWVKNDHKEAISMVIPLTLHYRFRVLAEVAKKVFIAFVPFPGFSEHHLWNSTCFLVGYRSYILVAILILLFSLVLIWDSFKARLFFLISVSLTLLFSYIVYLGYNRHFGYIYLAFIASLWILIIDSGLNVYPRWKIRGVYFLLGIQCVSGIYMIINQNIYPFAQGRDAAFFLKKEPYNHLPIYISDAWSWVSLDGYLNNRKMTKLHIVNDRHFPDWTTAIDSVYIGSKMHADFDKVLEKGDSAIFIVSRKYLFITDTILTGRNHLYSDKIKQVAEFNTECTNTDHYYIYLVTPKIKQGT
jgi:hypothetical protein